MNSWDLRASCQGHDSSHACDPTMPECNLVPVMGSTSGITLAIHHTLCGRKGSKYPAGAAEEFDSFYFIILIIIIIIIIII